MGARRNSLGFTAGVVGGIATLGVIAVAAITIAAGSPSTIDRAVTLDVSPEPATVLDGDIIALVPDVLLTSERFRPRVTFQVRSTESREPIAELCFEHSDTDTIVFGHIMGCVEEVRIIHVAATECGSRVDEPNADSVAEAMLARPHLGAIDRGVLEIGRNVPKGFLRAPLHGRVIDVEGIAEPRFDLADPDGCRLLPTHGSDARPTEIRRDLEERYVLIDTRGGLVVVRAGANGQDGASAMAQAGRGYGNPGPEGIWHILSSIHDISFD